MNHYSSIKWWWRYGTEKEALWIKIINAKYRMDNGDGFPRWKYRESYPTFGER